MLLLATLSSTEKLSVSSPRKSCLSVCGKEWERGVWQWAFPRRLSACNIDSFASSTCWYRHYCLQRRHDGSLLSLFLPPSLSLNLSSWSNMHSSQAIARVIDVTIPRDIGQPWWIYRCFDFRFLLMWGKPQGAKFSVDNFPAFLGLRFNRNWAVCRDTCLNWQTKVFASSPSSLRAASNNRLYGNESMCFYLDEIRFVHWIHLAQRWLDRISVHNW